MHYPQLLIHETDGTLAAELRELASKKQRWSLREPRQREGCLRLLQRGGPSILVIKVGRDVENELTLLDQVSWLSPETRIVAVSDTENPLLADLAWDLGATFVLFPPQPRERLVELVESLMQSFPKRPLPLLPAGDITEEKPDS
jgi:DNA-binding NarL/FixJ family response regulator